MKKIKSLLSILIFGITIFSFWGCEDNRQVSFNQTSIEILEGQVVDLVSYLELTNTTIKDVKITSSDNSIAYVTPEKTLGAISKGRVIVKAEVGKSSSFFTVNVIKESVSLSAPVGLRYDKTKNAFVWNEVYANIDNNIFSANSYTVWVKKDSEQPQIFENVLTNKFEITGNGSYEIKVKTNKRSDVILGSDYCSSISMTKLSSPTNVRFDSETSILSWTGSADKYNVSVNGVSIETQNNYMQLNLTLPNVYKIYVSTLSNAENAIDAVSETLSLTRLSAPALQIENGEIKWQSAAGVEKYEVTISKQYAEDVILDLESEITKYALTGLATGEYSVKVVAKAGSGFLDSAASNAVNATKLASPSIEFNESTRKIRVNGITGNSVQLSLTDTEGTKENIILSSSNSYEYSYTKNSATTFTIKAITQPNTLSEIISDVSNVLRITQLANAQGLVHTANDDGNSIITFNEVVGADHYEVEKVFNNAEFGLATLASYNASGANLGQTDIVFNEVGNYVLNVIASCAAPLEEGEFILSSTSSCQVERLPNVSNVTYNNVEGQNKNVSWGTVANRVNYYYEFIKNNNTEPFLADYATDITSYEVEDFRFGNYIFKIKAMGNGTTTLDSLDYSESEFSLSETLNTPEYSFNRETKVLTLHKSENATGYVIKHNNSLIQTYNVIEDFEDLDLSSYVSTVGEHEFTFYAQNIQNELLFNSIVNADSTFTVEKLSAPTSIDVSRSEVITVASYAQPTKLSSKKTTVLVNDIEKNTLDESTTFTIKALYNAKTTPAGNVYYIDSDYSTFVLNRLTAPSAITFSEQKLKWQLYNGEFADYVCNLEISQGTTTNTINMAKQTEIDAESNAISQIANIALGYNAKLTYKVGNITVTDEGYISSLPTALLNVSKLSAPSNVLVAEAEGVVTVSWADVTNASKYILNISKNNDTTVINVTTNSCNSYNFNDAASYFITIQSINDSYINSNLSTQVKVERLSAPTSANVNSQEELTITNQPATSKLEKTKIELDVGSGREEVTGSVNFSEINSNIKIYATFISKKMTSGYNFYLDSQTSEYNFQRSSTMSAVTFADGNINWITSADAYMYQLMFAKVGKTSKYYTITNKNQSSIALSTLASILNEFGATTINVSIRMLQAPIQNLQPTQTGILSAKDFSPQSQLTKLTAPTNLALQATDMVNQNNLTISWQHTDESKTDKYEIYSGSTLIAEATNALNVTVTDLFTVSGNYNIKVKAIGSNENMTSEFSVPYSFTRLASPTGLLVNKNAQLSWQSISNSASYLLYYTLPTESEETLTVNNPKDLSELLANVDNKREGITDLKVQAIGNGTTTLSSAVSTDYNIDVLKKPVITVGSDKFSATADITNLQNAKIYVTITRDDSVVYLNNYALTDGAQCNYPSTLPAGNYTISAVTISSNSSGYISSATAEAHFTKLAAPEDLHFIRILEAGNESSLQFRVKTVENASGYDFEVSTYSTREMQYISVGEDNYLKYDITNTLLNSLADRNTFAIYALGGKIGEVNYINSSLSSISASMLKSVNNLKATNGILSFDSVQNVSIYKMLINDTVYDVPATKNFSDIISTYVGLLSINVKGLGNITTEKTYQNVVLDSRYIGSLTEGVYTQTNYSCEKLDQVSYFSVNSGYICVNSDESVSSYELLCNERTYNDVEVVDTTEIAGETYSYLYSSDLYADLEANQTYAVKIKIKSTLPDIINSNYSSEINIKIPEAIQTLNWNMNLKTTDLNTNYYDLSDSYISWQDLDKGYGYITLCNGVRVAMNINKYAPKAQDYLEGSLAFKVAIMGGSEVLDGAYILNSKFTQTYNYTFLQQPEISVENGLLTWTEIDNATGYYVYLNGNVYNNRALTALSLNIPSAGDYEIGVQAVSTTTNFFAGQKTLYSDEDDETITVKKLASPKLFTIENGRLFWTEGFDSINELDLASFMVQYYQKTSDKQKEAYVREQTFASNPFASDLLNSHNQNLVLRFSTQNSSYNVSTKALEFLTITAEQLSTIQTLATFGGYSQEYEEILANKKDIAGWPTKVYLFDELASSVPYGEYDLSVRQDGNNYDYLTSAFGTNTNIYIPGAPRVSVSFTDDIYYLNWNAVTIPQKFKDGVTKYSLLGNKKDGTKNVLLQSGINANQLNLTELVEGNVLTSDFKEIFIFVEGNNTNILNGKTSNVIEIEVLEEVNARVVDGCLAWDSQPSASAYEVVYTGGALEDTYKLKTTENEWNCAQLEEGYSYADVTIKSLGTETQQLTKFVIAGPVTNIGTLTKLVAPAYNIVDGLIEFDDIENSSSYQSHRFSGLITSYGEEATVENIVKEDNIIVYNPETIGENTYFLKTMGTTELSLTESTTAYINSDITDAIKTYKHEEISNIKTSNGVLNWSMLRFADLNISNYKLIFARDNLADLNVDIIGTQSASYSGYGVEYVYDGMTYNNLISGEFKAYIVGYAIGNKNTPISNDGNFSTSTANGTVYLLQSGMQEIGTDIKKLVSPEDVNVTSGKVCFYDAENDADASYDLEFSPTSGGQILVNNLDQARAEEFSVENGVWSWEGYLNNDMTNYNTSSYNLKLRRKAITAYEMNSNYNEYRAIINNEVGEYIIITQANAISSTKIEPKEVGGEEQYVISWEDYETTGDLSENDVSYCMDYYTTIKGSIQEVTHRQIIIDNGDKFVPYSSLIQEENTDMLVYKLQVMIGRNNIDKANYLNSRWTAEIGVEKPLSVAEITYDTVSQKYNWTYDNEDTTKNLKFIITDYFVDSGVAQTDLDSLDSFTKNTYYIPVSVGENTYTYYARQTGLHIISIEVSVANAVLSDISSFKSGMVYYRSEEGNYTQEMNLFASGSGTSVSPYLIRSEEQFNNIRYRQTVESFFAANEIIHFKQTGYLTINGNIVTDETTTYSGFINEEFNAEYDGDYYGLTFNTSLTNLNSVGGLFANIGLKGTIKNLKYDCVYSGTTVSNEIDLGLLAKYNKGTIRNVIVGNIASNNTHITITDISKPVKMSTVVYENTGTIEYVKSTYNITLRHIGAQYYSSINVGMIACINKGSIDSSGASGNITVYAYEGASVGGIASRAESGRIQECYFNGNISFNYSSSVYNYYCGGIVGAVTGGYIWNSYSKGSITVNHNKSNPAEVSVGGLVGKTSDSKYINNSFSYTTMTLQDAQGTTISANVKRLVGKVDTDSRINAACYSTVSDNLCGGSGMANIVIGVYLDIQDALNENDGEATDTFENATTALYPNLVCETIFNALVWKSIK